jgi:quinol monooxygenase YgiN
MVTPWRAEKYSHMAASVHVFARFLARPGKEQAVKTLLTALIAPARRELGCYQYDLLENPANPRELCIVERWDGDKAFDKHLEMPYLTSGMAQLGELLEVPSDIRRYRVV